MPPETVQIGSFVVSRLILDLTIPLLSVIVGGLITYFTTRALEYHRLKIEQKVEFINRKREALGQALRWADIVDKDVTWATLVANNFLRGMIDEKRFRERWPDVLSELAEKDIPPYLGVLLPEEAYHIGQQIVRQLGDLYLLSLRASAGKSDSEEWKQHYEEFLHLSASLHNQVKEYRDLLKSEYLKTFGKS